MEEAAIPSLLGNKTFCQRDPMFPLVHEQPPKAGGATENSNAASNQVTGTPCAGGDQ